MHRSRFCGFVIDCQVDDIDAAASFWSQALGRPIEPPAADSPGYRSLSTAADEPVMIVQKVTHPSRVHLDIESDDVDAEVARLERLGAKRVQKVSTWWVMEAPSGQRFCVVRLQHGSIEGRGNEWRDE